jgi:FtsH-binding integral membrane protein
MDGVITPASIAIMISMGGSLLAGLFGLLVAIRSETRDTAVLIFFGIALLLTVLFVIAAGLIAAGGMHYVGVMQAALLLTAVFAVVGTVFGLMRGRRSGKVSSAF